MPKKPQKQEYKSFDFILFITVLLLLALGITMVLSASSPSSLATTGSSYTYVLKQAFCAAIGIGAMILLSKSVLRFNLAIFLSLLISMGGTSALPEILVILLMRISKPKRLLSSTISVPSTTTHSSTLKSLISHCEMPSSQIHWNTILAERTTTKANPLISRIL